MTDMPSWRIPEGLVTCFNGYLNTPYFANEAGVKIHFGVIAMEGLIAPRFVATFLRMRWSGAR